jgi:hypothetical protein
VLDLGVISRVVVEAEATQMELDLEDLEVADTEDLVLMPMLDHLIRGQMEKLILVVAVVVMVVVVVVVK